LHSDLARRRSSPQAPADELWRKFSQKKRQVILKATEKMSISTLDDPAVFMRFCEANLGARGIKNKRNVPTCAESLMPF
jgi:hypothetical protein